MVAHYAYVHAYENLLWASRSRSSRHTFSYAFMNTWNPASQAPCVWRIPIFFSHEKHFGYHPTQKPLRLVRRALLASTQEVDLDFVPFAGSGTTAVAAKELNRAFVRAELDEEYAGLAARHISATKRESLLRKISEHFWSAP
jgi:site-specific DNA-methyltransferase (adenine-specific)